jgi:hypothetical protein
MYGAVTARRDSTPSPSPSHSPTSHCAGANGGAAKPLDDGLIRYWCPDTESLDDAPIAAVEKLLAMRLLGRLLTKGERN